MRQPLYRLSVKSLALLGFLLCALPSAAQFADGFADGNAVLTADEVSYDDANRIVRASGNVQVLYDPYILYADELAYDERADLIIARGNVALLDAEDNVVFGDYVELTGDLRGGLIEGVSGLLADDSRLAGTRAERRDGVRTIMEQAVYSPCDICDADESGEAPPPIWQIKARRVIHDAEKKDLIYRDARLEIAGVPVAYMPYFSHPDPTVRSRTGFLTPSIGFDGNLGAFVRSYYYLALADNYDATIETSWTRETGPLGAIEWRHRLPFGEFELLGSITSGDRDEGTTRNPDLQGDGVRGHLFGSGRFDLSDKWLATFGVQITSDDNYLRVFDYSEDDILVTEGRVERFSGNDYASIRAFFVDDLRPGIRPEQPVVLPSAELSLVGEPRGMLGGRWRVDSSILSLTRDPGQDVHRIASGGLWERRLIAPIGLITDVQSEVRGVGYWLFNRETRPDAEDSSDLAGRLYAHVNAQLRYPIARTIGEQSLVFEPTISGSYLPETLGDDSEIPNEDSTDVELDSTNLFALSRFPGIDRIEDGARATVGIKAGLYGFRGGGFVAGFIGQSLRFSGDENFPDGSGLEGDRSDFVGSLQVSPGSWLDMEYRFRMDNNGFDSRRHEVSGTVGNRRLRLFTNYLFVQAVEGTGIEENRNELTLVAQARLSNRWRVAASGRQQLGADNQFLRSTAQIAYEDECFMVSLNFARDNTDRIGDDDETSVFLRFNFRNLGGFSSPNLFEELVGLGREDL